MFAEMRKSLDQFFHLPQEGEGGTTQVVDEDVWKIPIVLYFLFYHMIISLFDIFI